MNATPIFCCAGMAQLFSSGEVRITRFSNSGDPHITIGSFDRGIPLNFCPSCGKEFHLTFLTDSEVYR